MFNVAEKFVSINGEGSRAGQLAVFIRLAGCNLACPYCDTKWAKRFDYEGELLSAQDIFEYIISTGVTNVTLTGGEPLLHDGIEILIGKLVKSGLWVEVETNGSVALKPTDKGSRPHFTMDYKLPSSGMEDKMLLSNFDILESGDVVKFVCSDVADLERAYEIINKYELTKRRKVYFSCVFGKLAPAEAVEFMKRKKLNGVNFQLQMHKFIWDPDKKGV
ncbi:MAG: putative 7-carboxy-7-deazaguanine synthase QueE [Oscillospiraceae bacterium]